MLCEGCALLETFETPRLFTAGKSAYVRGTEAGMAQLLRHSIQKKKKHQVTQVKQEREKE
jgi:hypothetical protein